MALKRSPKLLLFPRRAKHVRHAPWRSAVSALEARVSEIERSFVRLDRNFASLTVRARLRNALVLSLLTHLLVIYGIAFKVPDRPADNPNQRLEVVLVNAKSEERPLKPDALAQHSLDGGGNVEEKRRAQSPLPVMPEQKQEAEVKLALRRVEQLEREAKSLLTSAKSKTEVETAQPAPKTAPQSEPEPKPQLNATDLMQRSLEIARLEAKISKDWDAYQQRPRRRFVGARTQEYRFARYVEDWRQKVERIGDLNYPQGARDQRLSGSLLVTVAIRSDGTVEQIDINRSSGHKILDEAARRIVELSGPFAAFPPDIAKDTDILHITRTWTFTPADRFKSE